MEDLFDIGGQFADIHYLEEQEEHYLTRIEKLKGKYVITCTGISSHKKCYLQDRSLNKGGWWTEYLANAFGYANKEAAERKCQSFKYNNCKVEHIA